MKLTKMLAMLLALCMIICCFAACGGSDDDKDDDKDEKVEDKEKDEDEDEDEDQDKDDDKGSNKKEDADLEGRWKGELDLGDLLANGEDAPELVFGIVIEFRSDGNYTSTAVGIPSVDEFAEFFMDMYEADGMTEEDAEEEAEMIIEEIKKDPRVAYGEYTVDGDVITLDEQCEITFDINGDEMTFEDVDSANDVYFFFKDGKFEKQ